MQEVIQAYSYVRLSTKTQLGGVGLERQMEGTRKAAKANGWILSEVSFSDLGVSAWKGKNIEMGALRNFLDAVESGAVASGSVLMVENVDRLSRAGVNTAVSLMMRLLESGISIYTVHKGQLFTPESENPLMDLMYYALEAERGHSESVTKSKRVLDAKQKAKLKAREGKIHTAMCPHWLKVNDDRSGYIVIEKRANVIRDVFTRYAAGTGTPTLCRELTEEGVMASSGKPWHPSAMRKLLRNRTVLGELQLEHDRDGAKGPDGEALKGHYPAIVSDDLWAAVQSKLADGGTLKGRKCASDYNVLAGLLKCTCGASIHMTTTKYKVKNGVKYSRRLRCSLYRISCEHPPYPLEEIVTKALTLISSVPMVELTDDHKKISNLKAYRDELSRVQEIARRKRSEALKLADAIATVDYSEILLSKLVDAERATKDAEGRQQELEGLIKGIEDIITGKQDGPEEAFARLQKLAAVVHEDNDDEQSRMELNLILRRYIGRIVCGPFSMEIYGKDGGLITGHKGRIEALQVRKAINKTLSI